MKTLLLALSIFSFANLNAKAAKDKDILIVKTSIACDHCLQCSSCGQNINDQIRDAEKGIKKVKINPKENTITVTYASDKTNPEAIRKAIALAGYDADEVKADKASYEKLDACCRK